MSFTEKELRLLREPKVNLAFFLRIELPTKVLRLYAGAGDFPLPPDSIETDGGVYTCIGNWGPEMPELDHLRNAQVQVMDLVMAGVDLETALSYVRERGSVVGARSFFGWCVLDERNRPAGSVHWRRRGYLAKPTLERKRTAPNLWSRSIGVSHVTGPVRRRKPVHTYLTGPDQRRRSPDDSYCDGTSSLNAGRTRLWPN